MELLRAGELFQAGDLDGAAEIYHRVLEQDAVDVEALYALAVISIQQQHFDDAEKFAERLTDAGPEIADAWNVRANLSALAGRTTEALAFYDRALSIQPALAVAHLGRCELLAHLGRTEEAVTSCAAVVRFDRRNSEALRLLGQLLLKLDRLREAAAALRAFLAMCGSDANALIDLGVALSRSGESEEALAAFNEALILSPDNAQVLYNRANLYSTTGRFAEAAADCAQAVKIDPELDFVHGTLLWAQLQLNDWSEYDSLCKIISDRIQAGRNVISPQQYLSIATSPALALDCARQWSRSQLASHPSAAERGKVYGHERIHVGYVSADYKEHATTDLIAGVFEHHDRGRFQVTAISLTPGDGSSMRRRLESGIENFFNAEALSDEEIASYVRENEIDILVDLKGYTHGARPNVFAKGPAPIQVAFIGMPGSTGTDFIDYIIADRFVIPEEHFCYFSEKVVWLPHTYQCNDDKRSEVGEPPPRSHLGLPENEFVFCCFNANYKIQPPTFDLWMRIMSRTKDSVLWLLEPGETAIRNLRREAVARGVDAARLIFAPRMQRGEHLKRLSAADLILDTLPYNAHTTAADALWAGIPVLTLLGSTFPGRVATSLLNAIGLQELVMTTEEEFEGTACRLASVPGMLSALRTRLRENRDTEPLFDTARFTRNLEHAYTRMWEGRRAGNPLESFGLSNVNGHGSVP